MNYTEKIIEKIQNITYSSESDSRKILAGITIIAIAISWFIIGSYMSNDEEDMYIKNDIQKVFNDSDV